MNSKLSSFETCYDTYGAMLYGIAIEISPSVKEAQEILISTFKKAYNQKLIELQHPSLCITFIKLLLQTAQELFYPAKLKNNFSIKQFENMPVLHELICGQISAENYSAENKITRMQLAGKIKEEFGLLRNFKKTMQSPGQFV